MACASVVVLPEKTGRKRRKNNLTWRQVPEVVVSPRVKRSWQLLRREERGVSVAILRLVGHHDSLNRPGTRTSRPATTATAFRRPAQLATARVVGGSDKANRLARGDNALLGTLCTFACLEAAACRFATAVRRESENGARSGARAKVLGLVEEAEGYRSGRREVNG